MIKSSNGLQVVLSHEVTLRSLHGYYHSSAAELGQVPGVFLPPTFPQGFP